MTTWHNLYLFYEHERNTLLKTIQQLLNAQAYTLYDPYRGRSGASYPQTLRFFLAPAHPERMRILVETSSETALEHFLMALSQQIVCLEMWLDGTSARVHVYAEGALQSDLYTTLLPFTITPQTLKTILNTETFDLPALATRSVGDIPLQDLPDDLQQMLRQANIKQGTLERIFKRLTRRLMGDQQRAAGAYLQTQSPPDWNSQGGQYLRALSDCLHLPQNWRDPDFASLRIAYGLYQRQQQRPDARLLPGDADAMRAVPDALSYTPIYGGQK